MLINGSDYAYRWNGANGGLFQTGGNWVSETAGAPAAPPGAGTEADFLGSGQVDGTGTVNAFNVVGTAGSGFSFSGHFTAGEADFAGNAALASGTTLTANNYIAIGHKSDAGAATLSVQGSATLFQSANGAGLSVGAFSTGTLSVVGTGALVNLTSNEISVGYGGHGQLSVGLGGTLEAGTLVVGDQSGSGTVQVSAATVKLGGGNYDGGAVIGLDGRGVLVVNGYGLFTCGNLVVGSATAGVVGSEVDVATASLFTLGSVTVNGGSVINLSAGSQFSAAGLSDYGTITQTGENTQAGVTGTLNVIGTYLVESQSALTLISSGGSGGLAINGAAGSPAMVIVDDATLYGGATSIGGSYGSYGVGTLVVRDGGTATLTSLSLESASASAASAIDVAGAGSHLSLGGGIYAGYGLAGPVSLDVSAGAGLSIGANGNGLSLDISDGMFTAESGAQVTAFGQLQIEMAARLSADAATLHVAGLQVTGAALLSDGATLASDTSGSSNYALNLAIGSAGGGQFTVTGSHTLLSTTGPAAIGSGTLTISAGAVFDCQATASYPNALILNPPNSGGPASVLDVTGAGSTLAVTGNLIAYYDPGETLAVSGGAVARIDGSVIDARLNVLVSGVGSLLDVTGSVSSTQNDPYGGTTLSVLGGAVADIGDGSHLSTLTLVGTLDAAGSVQIDSARAHGTIDVSGTLDGGGIIQAAGGKLVINGATLGGVLAVGGGNLLVLGGAGVDTSAMEFLAGGGTLQEASTAKLSGISDFGAGDFVDLTGVHAVSDSFANGTLTLLDKSHASVGMLVFGSGYSAGSFVLSHDGVGGTKVGFHG